MHTFWILNIIFQKINFTIKELIKIIPLYMLINIFNLIFFLPSNKCWMLYLSSTEEVISSRTQQSKTSKFAVLIIRQTVSNFWNDLHSLVRDMFTMIGCCSSVLAPFIAEFCPLLNTCLFGRDSLTSVRVLLRRQTDSDKRHNFSANSCWRNKKKIGPGLPVATSDISGCFVKRLFFDVFEIVIVKGEHNDHIYIYIFH